MSKWQLNKTNSEMSTTETTPQTTNEDTSVAAPQTTGGEQEGATENKPPQAPTEEQQSDKNKNESGGQQEEGAGDKQQQQEDEQKGAPETYEIEAPKGVTYDAEVMGNASEVFRELNLPNDAANKIVNSIAPAIAEAQAKQIKAIRDQWETAFKTDPDIGGDKADETLAMSAKGRDAFGSDALKQLLEDTGFGSHPEFLRYFAAVGRATSNDGMVGGRSGGNNPSTSDVLYDHPTS